MANETKPRAAREAIGSWCIWTKTGRRPAFFHPTQELAEAEAARLAERTPGKKYLVMQVVSKFGLDPLAQLAAEDDRHDARMAEADARAELAA
jgi:hypothetical protein